MAVRLTRSEIARIRRLKTVDMRRAFLRSWTGIRDTVVLNDLVRMLSANNIDGALDVINLRRANFASMETAMADAYATAGTRTAGVIGNVRRNDVKVAFGFDARAPGAEQWLLNRSADLITGNMIGQQTTMLREFLTAGLANGRNPRETALDLVGRINRTTGRREGGVLGLSRAQTSHVESLRLNLSDPSTLSAYFQREARDKRFDGTVRRAMSEGRALNQAELDKVLGRYSDNLLRLRGESVARTETLTALRAGQQESIQQAMTEEGVQNNEVKKTWSSTGDDRTRDDHMDMDGETVPIDEPFELPDGSLVMFPGDVSMGADAAQIINCRCTAEYNVDFIGRALRMEGF